MVDQTELAGVAARLARLRQQMLDEGRLDLAKHLSHAISDIKKVRAAAVVEHIPWVATEATDVIHDEPATEALPADRRKAARAARRMRRAQESES